MDHFAKVDHFVGGSGERVLYSKVVDMLEGLDVGGLAREVPPKYQTLNPIRNPKPDWKPKPRSETPNLIQNPEPLAQSPNLAPEPMRNPKHSHTR